MYVYQPPCNYVVDCLAKGLEINYTLFKELTYCSCFTNTFMDKLGYKTKANIA